MAPRITAHDSQGEAVAKLRETMIADLSQGDYRRETLARMSNKELYALYSDESGFNSYVERTTVS